MVALLFELVRKVIGVVPNTLHVEAKRASDDTE